MRTLVSPKRSTARSSQRQRQRPEDKSRRILRGGYGRQLLDRCARVDRELHARSVTRALRSDAYVRERLMGCASAAAGRMRRLRCSRAMDAESLLVSVHSATLKHRELLRCVGGVSSEHIEKSSLTVSLEGVFVRLSFPGDEAGAFEVDAREAADGGRGLVRFEGITEDDLVLDADGDDAFLVDFAFHHAIGRHAPEAAGPR